MAKVGLSRAAELTGKSRSTIHRAMKDNRLSWEMSEAGERVIDVSELNRVFEVIPDDVPRNSAADVPRDDTQQALTRALDERIADLLAQIEGLKDDKEKLEEAKIRAELNANNLLEDLREERKQIRLLTDQREKTKPIEVVPPRRGWLGLVAGLVVVAAMSGGVVWVVLNHPELFAAH